MPVIPGSTFFSPLHYPFSPLLFSLFSCIFEDFAGVWGWRKSAELLKYLTDYLWLNWQYFYYQNLETTFPIPLPSVIPAYNWSKIATLQGRKEAIEISVRILQWSNWQRICMCPCSPVTIFLTTLSQGWCPPSQCCLFRNSSVLRGKSFPLMSPWIPLYRPCIQTYVHHYCVFVFRNSVLHIYVCDARNTSTSLSELQFPLSRFYFPRFSFFFVVLLFLLLLYFVFKTRSYVCQASL